MKWSFPGTKKLRFRAVVAALAGDQLICLTER